MTTLAAWRDEWITVLENGRPGPETVIVYRRGIDQFLSWLAEQHPDVTDESTIAETHTLGFMRHLKLIGKADATRRLRGIALRKFCQYIVDNSELSANPAAGLYLPVPKAPPVPTIPDADLDRLLRSMSGRTFIDLRDTAIIRLLLDTGIRRAELVAINIDDVDFSFTQVLVHGKGSKDRLVPFSGRTKLALQKYLRVRATRPAADAPALFLPLRVGTVGAVRLTGGGVGEMLTRRCAAAGLGHIHPHQFRHSWAAFLKGAGIGDDQLERLAGWTTPTMSRRYGAHVADEQARAAARRLAPGDRV